MNVSGIGTESPATLASALPDSALGKEAFLELLVTQLKNQDPLNPTSNEDMIAQLAQFSSLEEMQNLNENILGLAVLQQSNALLAQLTDSSALIGKSVAYIDPETGEQSSGVVDSVKISEDGIAVLNIDGLDVPLANVLEVQGEPSTDTDTDTDTTETDTTDETDAE